MTGHGIAGWLKGSMMTLGLGGLVLGASYTTTRNLLQKFVLPKPGEGPDRKLQHTGFFNLLQIGVLPDESVLWGRITGDQDPGYGSTSKMLSECAVCLAQDDLSAGGGVWTPAAVMARPLCDRLMRNAGITFALTG